MPTPQSPPPTLRLGVLSGVRLRHKGLCGTGARPLSQASHTVPHNPFAPPPCPLPVPPPFVGGGGVARRVSRRAARGGNAFVWGFFFYPGTVFLRCGWCAVGSALPPAPSRFAGGGVLRDTANALPRRCDLCSNSVRFLLADYPPPIVRV